MTAAPATFLQSPPAVAPPRPAWRSFVNLPVILTALYLLVCGNLIFRHVMWLDEAKAFLLARDSHSFGELFYNLRYEGHPPLWHILLFLITRITDHPEAMQLLHLLMASASVYLVARFSPLPVIAKILFPFGYFALFEYGIISRNYQLVMLLTFAFCALWQHRRTAYLRLALLLALLCLTHVLGLIIATGLGLSLLLDALFTAPGRAAIRGKPLFFIATLLIVAAGAALSIYCLIPPPDYSYATGWHFDLKPDHLRNTLTALWDGLLPIPSRQIHFWDYHLFVFPPDQITSIAWRGAALALAALLLVCNSWRAVLFYLIAILGQLAIFHVKFQGGTRHHGEMFVALVAAFWIAWAFQSPIATTAPAWRKAFHIGGQLALVGFLAIHLYSGIVAGYYAWKVPFTPARDAVAAIKRVMGPDDLLVSEHQVLAAPLAIYFPGKQFYLAEGERWGTFTLWKRFPHSTTGLAAARRLAREKNKPVILSMPYALPFAPPGVTPIAGYGGPGDDRYILEMERYFLYRVE